ncbi:MAG TPA: hypothetical protein VIF62_17880 [Labilithrix sp.]|jgi:hypothetical protein
MCFVLLSPSAASADVGIGARAGLQWIYLEGDGSPSDLRGYVFGADLHARVTKNLALATGLDASLYDRRSDRLPYGRVASSFAPFVGLRLDTNPEGPWSARIELATAARWITLPLDGESEHLFGIEPLRLRVGPAVRIARSFDLALLLGAGFGWFTSHSGASACAATASCADSRLDSDTSSPVHFVTDFTLVGTWRHPDG